MRIKKKTWIVFILHWGQYFLSFNTTWQSLKINWGCNKKGNWKLQFSSGILLVLEESSLPIHFLSQPNLSSKDKLSYYFIQGHQVQSLQHDSLFCQSLFLLFWLCLPNPFQPPHPTIFSAHDWNKNAVWIVSWSLFVCQQCKEKIISSLFSAWKQSVMALNLLCVSPIVVHGSGDGGLQQG